MKIALVLLCSWLAQDETDWRVQRLKKELALSDEQVEKVKEIYKADKEAQQKIEKERQDKVREILTEEQKPRFDELAKGGPRVRGMRGGDGDEMKKALEEMKKQMEDLKLEDLPEGDGMKGFRVIRPGGGEESKAKPEKRLKKAMAALKIEDSGEADAVRSLVKKVVEAQAEAEALEKESRKAVDQLLADNASDESIEAKLGELRTKRKEKADAVRAAQKDLSEIVSYRQELELIRRGILK